MVSLILDTLSDPLMLWGEEKGVQGNVGEHQCDLINSVGILSTASDVLGTESCGRAHSDLKALMRMVSMPLRAKQLWAEEETTTSFVK